MQSQIDAAAEATRQLNASYQSVSDAIRASSSEQDNLNANIQKGNGLFGNFKSLLGGVAAFMGVKAGVGWIRESLDLTNQQIRAEQQLVNVLRNQGASLSDFNALKAKAAAIQSASMYGDEAMIGGAGELATYIKDTKALESMMGTLSNYAAGMSGGGEVNPQQMVQYATQLGKALDGSFDGLAKKGFALSDAQKEIIKNGTDMQKAVVIDEVISQSWAGLAEQMAQTPEGMRVSMANAIGDIRENVGAQLYPAIMSIMSTIKENMPMIEQTIMSLVPPIASVIDGFGQVALFAVKVAQLIGNNWSMLSPIIIGVAVALGLFNAASYIATTVMAIQKTGALVLAAAKMALSGASFSAMVAQWGLNAALLACPITWIIAGIVAVIAIFYAVIAAINHFAGTSLSATGIIMGAFAVLAAFIVNTVLGAINGAIQILWALFVPPIISIIEFVKNIFNGGFNGISGMFANMLGQLISRLLDFAKVATKIIDAVFGTKVSDSLTKMQNDVLQWGKNDKAVTMDRAAPQIDYRMNYGDTWNAANAAGKNLFGAKNGQEAITAATPSNFVNTSFDGSPLSRDVKDISGNTKKSADFSEENLKYLRDVAERDTINRFTTAEINFDMGGVTNNVSSGIDLINEGEVNILKKQGLSEISFTALIPSVQYPFAVYDSAFIPPDDFLALFERLKTQTDKNGKFIPFQFILTRSTPGGVPTFDLNMEVSLESYSISEEAANGVDINVDVSLKQYKYYGTKTIVVRNEDAAPVAEIEEQRETKGAPRNATHTVVPGDSLWRIAQQELGDGQRYADIYALNQDLIDSRNLKRWKSNPEERMRGDNRYTIYPGQVLQLPEDDGMYFAEVHV